MSKAPHSPGSGHLSLRFPFHVSQVSEHLQVSIGPLSSPVVACRSFLWLAGGVGVSCAQPSLQGSLGSGSVHPAFLRACARACACSIRSWGVLGRRDAVESGQFIL